MPINTTPGFPGSIGPTSGGKVTAAGTSVVGAQVVAGNPSRVTIVFHNPGTVNVFVYPLLNASGGVNSPSSGSPQGSFQLFPGGLLTLTGEVQGAWGAFSTGTGSLTVMESNV